MKICKAPQIGDLARS